MRAKAMLWKKLENGSVLCSLCAHGCQIKEKEFGFCGMRQNDGGELFTFAYGNLIASRVDPIEKKPLYHFLPGSFAYSIATPGCNFRCVFCQNWNISQVSAKDKGIEGPNIPPEGTVEAALRNRCGSISYTYTEPTIFFEYAYDTSRIAKSRGLYNTFVTNGYMTGEAIDAIAPYLDGANIDLKFFSDESYEKMCGGKLQPVLDSIRKMKSCGIWIEITTLIIPGKNDSEKEVRDIARFIAETGTEIPWHISRFHPDYQFLDATATPLATMSRAREIGIEEGLKYVYLGNVLTGGETLCPRCNDILIRREGFTSTVSDYLIKDGKCGECNTTIEGVWKAGR